MAADPGSRLAPIKAWGQSDFSEVKTWHVPAKTRKPRMALALRGLPKTQASSPLHGEARFLRYALPEPEKQRLFQLRPH